MPNKRTPYYNQPTDRVNPPKENWVDKLADPLGAAVVGVLPDEWIKKQVRSKVMVDDTPYLDEYFGKQHLEDAVDRPKSLTKYQDRHFKRLSEDNRKKMQNLAFKLRKPLSATPQRVEDMDGNTDFGLGRSTLSAALDENGKPYLSVFDSWDFDEKGSTQQPLDSLYRAVLKRLGKPYNVYERFPIREINPAFNSYEIYDPNDPLPGWATGPVK